MILLKIYTIDNPIVLFIILAFMIAGLLMMAWYLTKKNKRNEKIFQSLADKNNWRYTKKQELGKLGSATKTYHIFTPKEKTLLHWVLTIIVKSGGSNNIGNLYMHKTIWETDDIKLNSRLITIGPKPDSYMSGVDLGSGIAQMAFKMMQKKDDTFDTEGLQEIPIEDAQLNKHFLMYATNPQKMNTFLNANTKNALIKLSNKLSVKKMPSIVFSEKGLRIKCNDAIHDTEILELLVELGKSIKPV